MSKWIVACVATVLCCAGAMAQAPVAAPANPDAATASAPAHKKKIKKPTLGKAASKPASKSPARPS